MALPTELEKLRYSLRNKARATPNETNLLAELEALNSRMDLNETATLNKSINSTRMTSPDSSCPCCGR